MKPQLLTLLLLSVVMLSHGQDRPFIKTEARSIDEFVPPHWKIIRKAHGDLNQDRLEDMALVIQETNPKNIDIQRGVRNDTLDSNPRILMVALKDSATGKYKLNGISRTFILSHLSRTMDDPFDGVSISNGMLSVQFRFWYSAGSWYITTLEYKFKFLKNECTLVGAEFDQFHRGTMDDLKRSFNFLTKQMSETKSNDTKSERPTTEWENLDFKELKTLSTLTSPLQWNVLPDVEI